MVGEGFFNFDQFPEIFRIAGQTGSYQAVVSKLKKTKEEFDLIFELSEK